MKDREIHWSQLFGNPYRHALHPSMLSPVGYKVKMMAKIKGESKKTAFPVTVVFDEQYVIAKLAKILEQLQPNRYNDFQRLVSKAYEKWNEKRNKENTE